MDSRQGKRTSALHAWYRLVFPPISKHAIRTVEDTHESVHYQVETRSRYETWKRCKVPGALRGGFNNIPSSTNLTGLLFPRFVSFLSRHTQCTLNYSNPLLPTHRSKLVRRFGERLPPCTVPQSRAITLALYTWQAKGLSSSNGGSGM